MWVTLAALFVPKRAPALVFCEGNVDRRFSDECSACLNQIQNTPGLNYLVNNNSSRVRIVPSKIRTHTDYDGLLPSKCPGACLTGKAGCKGCEAITVHWTRTPDRKACTDFCAPLAHELAHASAFARGLDPGDALVPNNDKACHLKTPGFFQRVWEYVWRKKKPFLPQAEADAVQVENIYYLYHHDCNCLCPRYQYEAPCDDPDPLALARASDSSRTDQWEADCSTPRIACCGDGMFHYQYEQCDPTAPLQGQACPASQCAAVGSANECTCQPCSLCAGKKAGDQCHFGPVGGANGYCQQTIEGDLVCHTDDRTFCFQYNGGFGTTAADCTDSSQCGGSRCLEMLDHLRHCWSDPPPGYCAFFIWPCQ